MRDYGATAIAQKSLKRLCFISSPLSEFHPEREGLDMLTLIAGIACGLVILTMVALGIYWASQPAPGDAAD